MKILGTLICILLVVALARAQAKPMPDQPATGISRIYMLNTFRWGAGGGRAWGPKVDGWELKAHRLRYSFMDVRAGLHIIEWGKDKVPLTLEPGGVYYFTLTELAMSWVGWRLMRLSPEEAEFYLKTFKPDAKQIAAAPRP